MRNLKKALSVFLCAAMMFTTLCFFPIIGDEIKAEAAVVNTDKETAFYTPEVIYLYPDVTSWTAAVKTPFQYYVNNTVDTENIYNAPATQANLDAQGLIYFASEEGMSDVVLSVKFLDADGNYMDEADYGTVNFTKEDKGTYYLFTVTDGVAPELSAVTNGCFIEWCLTYKTAVGEEKAVYSYSYVYKPYVVPYGAATRVFSTYGDAKAFGQHITWVTGVHSIDSTATQTNTLYPYYMPLANVSISSDNKVDGRYSFSPFLSKDNKAYVSGVEVSGAAPVKNGGYNAVFAGTNGETGYFWANQTNAVFAHSYRVREFFRTYSAADTYPVAFDYMNNTDATTKYALSQVTPTRIGTVYVDTSRYNNLKDVPNLAVGMMLTDTDVKDGLTSVTPAADVQWYVGDATGRTHLSTGAYTSLNDITSARNGVYVKFAYGKDLVAPLDNGIWYAGAWNKELDTGTGLKTYTVKAYYEAEDREGDIHAASAALNLNVNQVDKSGLREAVNTAVNNFGVLGVKENWNSYYYDVNYVDPDTSASAWTRFEEAYKEASRVLSRVDATAEKTAEAEEELEAALTALLSGKGLRVYFDVNHDDIGVNLWINPDTVYYEWNAEDETAVINGSFYTDAYFGTSCFTPIAAEYTVSTQQVSGTFNNNGAVALDFVNSDGGNVSDAYNVAFGGTSENVISFSQADAVNAERIKFHTIYDSAAGDGVYSNFAVRIKIEEGSKATEYSPVGKVVGATYGTLPTPEREGYLFKGWCTDESLDNTVDASSAVSARVLYAKWEQIKYDVVFDGNGATGGEMAQQTLTYDETSKLNVNAYEKTGYVFSCWKDAEGNTYADGADVLNLISENEGKFTLYAQWTANQYSVAFDGNTGLGGLGMANAQYDTPFELPANYFIKTGYTFIGWSTTADGEVEFGDCEEVSNLTSEVNGSVTLYAVWKANTFNVVFDANGGSGNMNDASVVYDSEVSIPDCAYTKTGYTFVGWSLTNGEDAVIITETEYDNLRTEEGESVTLYAIWSENSYTLSFDMNGGEGEKIQPTVYGYEDEIVLPKNVFTKTGYILAGWSLTRDGEIVFSNGETVKSLNADNNSAVTLYAVWTPVKYTVQFNGNTGLGSMDELSMTYDVSVTLPENTFTKEGYHFIGWAVSANGEFKYADSATIKNITTADGSVITLWAVWEINTYTVTFNYINNKGENVSTPVTVEYGETAQVPNDFTTTPYKDSSYHYGFEKWSADITNVKSSFSVDALYPVRLNEAHDLKTTRTESTCKEQGFIRTYCSKCSYSNSVALPLASHTWDDGYVASAPGCFESGSFVNTCKVCGDTKSTAIDAVGHVFTAFPAKESTCSEQGNIAHQHCETCKKCFAIGADKYATNADALTEDEVKLPTLPHTPGAEATCTDPQLCTKCFAVVTPKLGHTEVKEYITTEASCTVEGNYIEKVTCSVCNASISEVAKFGLIPHDYNKTVTPPTCTAGGYTTYSCKDCGSTYRGNPVSKIDHVEGEWRVTKEVTCFENGVETNFCAMCDMALATRVITSTGHDSGEWVVTTPAECEEWGTNSLLCTKCGTVLSTKGIAPKGHGETKVEITVPAGCESMGRESTLCVDCGKELSFVLTDSLGHSAIAPATCEEDSICGRCNEILVPRFGHDWDDGVITKEPTETETGIRTHYCKNGCGSTDEEILPVRIVIVLPEIPADGTVDFDAKDENGYLGNIRNVISVEEGMEYTVTAEDNGVISIDSIGNMTALKDGETTITVTTADGKFTKSFVAAVRMIKTVAFDVRGTVTTVKSYVGDTVTAPVVESYTQGGFTYRFKSWTVDGVQVDDFTVTGDMTFVAVFTSSCNYTQLDKLTEVFFSVISGDYDNADEIKLYNSEIEEAKALIEEYSKDRDTRDADNQKNIDAAADKISALVSNLYPRENARVFIVGENTVALGSATTFRAYLSPLNTLIANGIWTSSDNSVGFFVGETFYGVKAGTVTVTVSSGNLSASMNVTVSGGANARVVMFDSIIFNANYIVEGSLIIKETTNMFWAPDAPVSFRVITDGTYEDYTVYINDKVATPDANGTYTIPANTGDAHVRVEGMVKEPDSGEKMSIWDLIKSFFEKIAEFFRNLFG